MYPCVSLPIWLCAACDKAPSSKTKKEKKVIKSTVKKETGSATDKKTTKAGAVTQGMAHDGIGSESACFRYVSRVSRYVMVCQKTYSIVFGCGCMQCGWGLEAFSGTTCAIARDAHW